MATSKITPAPLTRSLADVAHDIIADWSTDGTADGVWYGAVPYVRAMVYLDTEPDDGSLAFSYGDDRADERLCSAGGHSWRSRSGCLRTNRSIPRQCQMVRRVRRRSSITAG